MNITIKDAPLSMMSLGSVNKLDSKLEAVWVHDGGVRSTAQLGRNGRRPNPDPNPNRQVQMLIVGVTACATGVRYTGMFNYTDVYTSITDMKVEN